LLWISALNGRWNKFPGGMEMHTLRAVLVVAACWLTTVAALAAEDDGALSQDFTLDGPSFSALLLQDPLKTDFDLMLLLSCSKPGVVLDTVGLNAAPVGAWVVHIAADGHVTFQVFDPALKSPWRTASGWHVMTSKEAVAPGDIGLVELTAQGLQITFQVELGEPLVLPLRVPLSGDPIWVGDFPGDDHWGAGYGIHPAMTGRLMVNLTRGSAATPGPPAPPIEPEVAEADAGPSTAAPDPVPDPPTPTPQTATSAPPQPAPTPTRGATEDLEAVCAKVEAALRAGNLEALLPLIHPSRREALGVALAACAKDLPKLGEWLATRKLVSQDQTQAEYEVAVEDARLCVRFARADGQWWLLSL
jgi:hypothetical protein